MELKEFSDRMQGLLAAKTRKISETKKLLSIEDINDMVDPVIDFARQSTSRTFLFPNIDIAKKWAQSLGIIYEVFAGKNHRYKLVCPADNGLVRGFSKKISELNHEVELLELLKDQVMRCVEITVWPGEDYPSGIIFCPSLSGMQVHYLSKSEDKIYANEKLSAKISSIEDAFSILGSRTTLIASKKTENLPFEEASLPIIIDKYHSHIEAYPVGAVSATSREKH